MDKGGNFIGYLHADGVNLSVSLVEEGLAKVHFTAERGNYFKQLSAAEERAKKAKKNVSNFTAHTLGQVTDLFMLLRDRGYNESCSERVIWFRNGVNDKV